ncbi:hypothetical protein AALP_AA4G237500 [Arabis alpina]|uniref:Uncharacterized protein n=1 Tax=Arabis alpina TaxID=50452 RepID=A0A087H584_ARAAL|nr:hypothetical protein AALP_AA4G237500 [Arabis alpina]
MDVLWDSVPSYKPPEPKFDHFCEVCQYPTPDTYTMGFHLSSEVHAQKAASLEELSSEEEAPIVYQPNTSHENDLSNKRKFKQDDPLYEEKDKQPENAST